MGIATICVFFKYLSAKNKSLIVVEDHCSYKRRGLPRVIDYTGLHVNGLEMESARTEAVYMQGVWKMCTGLCNQGEDVSEAAEREVNGPYISSLSGA